MKTKEDIQKMIAILKSNLNYVDLQIEKCLDNKVVIQSDLNGLKEQKTDYEARIKILNWVLEK